MTKQQKSSYIIRQSQIILAVGQKRKRMSDQDVIGLKERRILSLNRATCESTREN